MKRIVQVTMTSASNNELKGMTAIKQSLITAGWQYKGSCNCGGMYTEKFQYTTLDGIYHIRTRNSNFFLLKTPTQANFRKLSIQQFKTIINEINGLNTAADPAQ